VLGKTHTYYQGARFVQADALWSLGYLDRAVAAYRELVVNDQAETQRNSVTIHQRIGAVELARERYADALPELQIALDFFRQATGPESTPTILIATARAEALLSLNRFDEARAELAALDIPAKEGDLRAATRWRLTAARLARHDRNEARARQLIDESLARLRKDGKEDAREAIGTWIALGELERDQGHVDAALEALSHARKLLDLQLATPTPQSRRVDEALKALAPRSAKP
jgi:tetratricopeptide (TPR) repeat protein